MTHDRHIACFGCGAMVPDIDGPTHPYIGSAPGCWAIYGEVLGREYGEFGYPEVHRICVDTYAVQHPRPCGSNDAAADASLQRKAIQSVAAHLVAIHCVIELGMDSKRALFALRKSIADPSKFWELDPPSFAGCLTIVDVARPPAVDVQEHSQRVRAWCESVWQAWSPHHDTVRRWTQEK